MRGGENTLLGCWSRDGGRRATYSHRIMSCFSFCRPDHRCGAVGRSVASKQLVRVGQVQPLRQVHASLGRHHAVLGAVLHHLQCFSFHGSVGVGSGFLMVMGPLPILASLQKYSMVPIMQNFLVGSLRFAGLFQSKTRQLCMRCSSLGNVSHGSWHQIPTNTCFAFMLHHALTALMMSPLRGRALPVYNN